MTIGIGILTWRRLHFVSDVVIPHIREKTVSEYKLALSVNCTAWIGEPGIELLGSGKNLGVAGGKNRIFCWFKNHPELEHLFLFEDDTYPIKKGWDQWYLDGHNRIPSVHAVSWQPVDFYGGVTSRGPRTDTHEAVGTHVDGMTLLSCTRHAVEKIGGMHRAFEGLNGQEHSEWMTRACHAKLTPFTNCTFVGCEEWVDGIDYQEWRWGKKLPGGKQRPEGDPATATVFGDKVYDKGRETFFRVKKNHRIGELYQDPCWDEETSREVTPP